MYYIYVIENLIDGKMYVGQTKNPDARKRQHFSPRSDCPYIKNAIKKYGKAKLEFSLIEDCSSLEEANEREKFWIKTLNTLRPFGYNLREGGEAGGPPSDETRRKMRLSHLGRKQTEEQKEKRAAAHRGRKNTPETIERMRQSAQKRTTFSMTGRRHSAETKRKMSIVAKEREQRKRETR